MHTGERMKRMALGLGIALIGAAIALPPAAAQSAAGARASGELRTAGKARTVKPATRAARPPSARPRGWASGLLEFATGGLLGALFGGEALFGILMVVLLFAIGIFVVRLVMRGREAEVPAGQRAGRGPEFVPPPVTPAPPASPAVGLNAMAPVEATRPTLPAGFDLAGFVRAAKLNFVRVQLAIDLGKLDAIRAFSMPQPFAELSKRVADRGGKGQQTDIVSLNAELVALVTEGDTRRASVRFSGMAREKPGAVAVGFTELWTLAKPAGGSTEWRLAGLRRVE